jgi:hypothetical protein
MSCFHCHTQFQVIIATDITNLLLDKQRHQFEFKIRNDPVVRIDVELSIRIYDIFITAASAFSLDRVTVVFVFEFGVYFSCWCLHFLALSVRSVELNCSQFHFGPHRFSSNTNLHEAQTKHLIALNRALSSVNIYSFTIKHFSMG